MPAHLEDTWPALRLIADGIVTWADATTSMSIDDVFDLNDAVAYLSKERNPPARK